MTLQQLDALVNRTELSPNAKQALRLVRHAMMSGRASEAEVGKYDWTVAVDTYEGGHIRFKFSLKKAA